MSRTNEIVAMLTAGVSIPRLLIPLIGMGLLTAGVAAALNYSLAPHADQARRALFSEMRDDARGSDIVGHIFRNRSANRTWFIQRFRPSENVFSTVQVLQQDAQDNIVKNYMAGSASYNAQEKSWELQGAKVVNYDDAGNITEEEVVPTLMVRDWEETPFRLASSNMRADFLSVPELREYLRYNADFPRTQLAPFETHLHYRVALPWSCLIFVFLAAPLGIGFSRRGVLTGVAAAIGLAFAMNFLTHLFLALGEGDRIAPWIAGWMPNVVFAAIGLALLYFRSSNRELREFNPFARPRLATR
jgi:lipopolysaccharide export LptBFGC system permease protein LptF